MALRQDCIIGRDSLPNLPCNYDSCPWFINGEEYSNCFWVVAQLMWDTGKSFSIKEIAEFEGVSESEAEKILAGAITRIRSNPKFKDELINIKK